MRRLRPGAVVALGATAAMAAVMLGSGQASAATAPSADTLVKTEGVTPIEPFTSVPLSIADLLLLQPLNGLDVLIVP